MKVLHGIPASPGLAVGPAHTIRPFPAVDVTAQRTVDQSEEMARLERAIEQATARMDTLRSATRGATADILAAQQEMMDDPELKQGAADLVAAGFAAEAAITRIASDYAEQLAALLIGSNEYFTRRGGGSNGGFLQALYSDVLHRAPDPGGMQVWMQALNSGMSRTMVARAVLASRESDTIEVQGFYSLYLRRPADSTGLSFFTNLLQQGLSEEAVIAMLISSDEYVAKAP